jgi:hypothetical protein
VASQAIQDSGFEYDTCAAVFGSAFGELNIAIDQLAMMETGDGMVSPALFKNSVHNTAAGVFAIATKNKGFTTALAAGEHTVGAVLYEAYGLLNSGTADVLAIMADECLPEPLRSQINNGVFDSLGVAFALSFDPGTRPYSTIVDLSAQEGGEITVVPESFHYNPIRSALGLFERIHAQATGSLALSPRGAQPWRIELGPAS